MIKTPGNAYRLGFLRAAFPNARLRVLHLTRNPAASVNGLVDGWLHHGFHAYRLDEPLRITGYADVRPADRHWWKFDLPPSWPEYTAAPCPGSAPTSGCRATVRCSRTGRITRCGSRT